MTGKKATTRVRSTTTTRPALKYAAPALEKGLDILELLAAESAGMIKSEIARRLNRTNSEVFRMLVCLQSRGYISQNEDEQYRLTLRLFELAQQHPPTKRLLNEAISTMHDIAARISQSCHLAIIDDGVLVILAQVDAPSSIGFFVKPGSQIDVMSAASGYVILAHLPYDAQARAVEAARHRGSRVPADLISHLERISRQGYEERDSYQVKGVVNISFPVLDGHGYAVAALTVPFLPRLDQETTDKDVIAALRRGAEQLSRALGHAPSVADTWKAVRASVGSPIKGLAR